MRQRILGLVLVGAIAGMLLVVLPAADAAPAEPPQPITSTGLERDLGLANTGGKSICGASLTTDGVAGLYVVALPASSIGPDRSGLYARNLITGAERRIVTPTQAIGLGCGTGSGDGQRYGFVSCTQAQCPGPVRVIDTTNGAVATVPGTDGAGFQTVGFDTLRFSDDHRYLFFAHLTGALQRYDTATGENRTVAFISDAATAGRTNYSISADGQRLAWRTAPGEGQVPSVWVTNLVTNQAAPASVRDGQQVPGGNPRLTPDGLQVAYEQQQAASFRTEVVRWNLVTNERVVASRGIGGAGESGSSSVEAVSANGRFVTYTSSSTNLTSGITYPPSEGVPPISDFNHPLFITDTATGTTTLISRSVTSAAPANAGAAQSSIDRAGTTVVFSSPATDLVSGYAGAGPQAYAYDTQAATVRLLSTGEGPTTASSYRVEDPVIAGTGGRVLLPRYHPNVSPVVPYVARVATPGTTPDVGRLEGFNRYDTAAQVSNSGFPDGAQIVFIASGESFPDALAAGPAAAAVGAPVLLSGRTALPPSTIEELVRLRPRAIYVIGGTVAIDDTVLNTLGSYIVGTGAFPIAQRVAGGDRYQTAVAISQRFFAGGAAKVHVASALGFADALSGGAAAAKAPGPILLTHPGGFPESVAAEITRLDPTSIEVFGGPNAVSEPVVQALGQFAPTVNRRAGADRYATSAAISAATFSAPVGRVYLATGTNFPDGLAASAVAGRLGAPVLLVRPECIPASVAAEIIRLHPGRIIVLGGPASTSQAIMQRTQCAS